MRKSKDEVPGITFESFFLGFLVGFVMVCIFGLIFGFKMERRGKEGVMKEAVGVGYAKWEEGNKFKWKGMGEVIWEEGDKFKVIREGLSNGECVMVVDSNGNINVRTE